MGFVFISLSPQAVSGLHPRAEVTAFSTTFRKEALPQFFLFATDLEDSFKVELGYVNSNGKILYVLASFMPT